MCYATSSINSYTRNSVGINMRCMADVSAEPLVMRESETTHRNYWKIIVFSRNYLDD